MRITPRLVAIASVLVSAGYLGACGSSNGADDDSDASVGDDAGADATADTSTPCDGACCPGLVRPTVDVTAAEACVILSTEIGPSGYYASGPECTKYCPTFGDGCGFAYGFATIFVTMNLDSGAGEPIDGGDAGDAGTVPYLCPTDAGDTVTITCHPDCTGRLTEGYVAPRGGDRFAAMAYLEEVSIYAFERLERELRAHGAGPDLLRDARRARRDEVRHTAMMTKLARRRGALPTRPRAPEANDVRSLFDIALENAVEGCVRETYGAVMGLVEAETASDADVRKAMRSIATDECRHAELAWAVHAWALPRLSFEERSRIENAMRVAESEIAARDPRTAALLFDASRSS